MTLSTASYPALAPIELGVPPPVVQPSRDTTGNTDVSNIQKAINAMAPTGGVVQLGPGVFYINSTITVPMQSGPGQGGYPVSLAGNYGATVLEPTKACETVISAHRSTMWGPTQNNSPNPMLLGSRLADFIVDGRNTSGAIGLDVGDCWGIEVQDIMLKNFTGSGAIGFYQANRQDWSEKCRFRLTCVNCTNCVVVDSPAGGVSHEYNDWDLCLYMLPGQNGITWQNGAFQGGGRVYIRGNHNPSGQGQPTGSVITVGGGPTMARAGTGPSSTMSSSTWCWKATATAIATAAGAMGRPWSRWWATTTASPGSARSWRSTAAGHRRCSTAGRSNSPAGCTVIRG
jgi:hypothetical protein